MRFVVLLWMLAIAGFLFSGLFSLLRAKPESHATVRALTWRIALSISLFAFLMLGARLGVIDPHAL